MTEQTVFGFESENGVLHIEVSEKIPTMKNEKGNVVFATGGGENTTVAKAAVRFDEVTNLIKNVSRNVVNAIEGLAKRPAEVEVQFGIKLGGEAGAFVAKASTEANFSITLKWVEEKNKLDSSKKG